MLPTLVIMVGPATLTVIPVDVLMTTQEISVRYVSIKSIEI